MPESIAESGEPLSLGSFDRPVGCAPSPWLQWDSSWGDGGAVFAPMTSSVTG
jgi:hypothetical protein